LGHSKDRRHDLPQVVIAMAVAICHNSGQANRRRAVRERLIAHLPEDLAAAYKQFITVERGWSDMKGALWLRPVFLHCEHRIHAYVQLCWSQAAADPRPQERRR
jgi:transposase